MNAYDCDRPLVGTSSAKHWKTDKNQENQGTRTFLETGLTAWGFWGRVDSSRGNERKRHNLPTAQRRRWYYDPTSWMLHCCTSRRHRRRLRRNARWSPARGEVEGLAGDRRRRRRTSSWFGAHSLRSFRRREELVRKLNFGALNYLIMVYLFLMMAMVCGWVFFIILFSGGVLC